MRYLAIATLAMALWSWQIWTRLREAEGGLAEVFAAVTEYNYRAAGLGLPQIGRPGDRGKVVLDPKDWERQKDQYQKELEGR